MTIQNDHVILAAIQVTGAPDRETAEAHLMSHTVMPKPYPEDRGDTFVACWWIAEDDRRDGSDCDSAVFVNPGRQGHAAGILHALGMTPDCNLVDGDSTRWDVAADVNAPNNDAVPNGAVYADALRIVMSAARRWADLDEPGTAEDEATARAALALLDGDVQASIDVDIDGAGVDPDMVTFLRERGAPE